MLVKSSTLAVTPTIEVEVYPKWCLRSWMVPSGVNCEYEAVELRDGDKSMLLRCCLKAVDDVNNASSLTLVRYDVLEQNAIDKLMIELGRDS